MIDAQPSLFLSEIFKRHAQGRKDGDTIINSILLVGAHMQGTTTELADLSTATMIGHTDETYLRVIAENMPEGFSFDTNPRLIVSNIAHDPSHDFMKYAGQVDMVVFCYIHFDPNKSNDQSLDGRQSPLATDDTVWHESLVRSGAKIVVNIVSTKMEPEEIDEELPLHLIERAPYTLIKLHHGPWQTMWHNLQDYQFLARQDHLRHEI